MRAAMAHPAIGSAFISVLAGLAVDSTGILPSLVHMTGGTDRFRHIGRMGIGFVTLMASLTGQPCVRAFLQFLRLLVARCAIGTCRRSKTPGGSPEQYHQKHAAERDRFESRAHFAPTAR